MFGVGGGGIWQGRLDGIYALCLHDQPVVMVSKVDFKRWILMVLLGFAGLSEGD